MSRILLLVILPFALFAQESADAILAATQHRVGVAIHLGSDDGDLRLALARATSFVVHGLEVDSHKVEAERQRIRQADLATRVSVETWKGTTLPLPDNFATIEGLSAAQNRIYLTTRDGRVFCFAQK